MAEAFLIATPSGWLVLDRDQFERALTLGEKFLPRGPTPPPNKPLAEPHEFITVEEAARRLGLPRSTVYRAVRQGRLPAIRVGRFYRVDAAAMATGGSRGGGQLVKAQLDES